MSLKGYLVKGRPEAARPTSEEEESSIMEVDDIVKSVAKVDAPHKFLLKI